MRKITIPIRGMHCKSCELLIENNVKNITGVEKVEVNHKTGKADIFYHKHMPTSESLKQAVKDAGYDIGAKGKLPWISKDTNDYIHLFKGVVILLIIYFIADRFGLFGLAVNTESTSLMVVLVVGLVAGISTCMALVGGLVLSLSARHAERHPEISAREKFIPHLYFNLGRIVGFGVLGGIIGLLGSVLSPSAKTLGFMTVIIGGVMIFLGLKLIEIFPALKDKSISLPKGISQFFGLHKEQKEYSHKGSFTTGALTFFLPCGFTQAMQLYAVSSGSFLQGAFIMSLFALGTAPGLLGIGGLASIFKGQRARVFFAATGVAVILLGWFNIANGSQLFLQRQIDTNNALTESTEVQEIRMTQDASGYSPSQFTVEKGKKVRWIIKSTSQFTCASSISVPKYGINKNLVKGENIIEFVPTEVGKVPFSCSMGMYRGVINVVESSTSATTKNNSQSISGASANVARSGTSCGGGGCGGCGGGSAPPALDTVPTKAQLSSTNEQVITARYTVSQDIVPNSFEVKKGVPVRFEIDVKESGQGCMGSIMIRNLYNNAQYLEGGSKLVMTFTPTQTGSFDITCAMGIPRGVIQVV